MQGRLIDRFGQPRVLLPAAGLQLVAVIGLVVTVRAGTSVWVTAGCAVVVGLGEPQVGGSLRALWAGLVPSGERDTATAFSSLLLEGPVVAGPVVLTGLLAVGGPAGAVLMAVALFAAGTWLLARSPAARGWRPPGRAAHRSVLGALASPGMRTVAAVGAAQGLITGVV